MAAQPTQLERDAIVDMASLAAWCNISSVAPPPAQVASGQAAGPAPVSNVQSLLSFLGSAPDEHYRSIATYTIPDWATEMTGILFNNATPSIMLKGKVALFHATARRLCNLEPWPTTASAQPSAASAPLVQNGLTGAQRVNLPVLNIGKVLDQRMSDEITFLKDADVLVMLNRYIQVMEVEPPADKAATKDQLTALSFMLDQDRNAYADLSIFGKHGHRRARAMSFRGMVIAPGGAMHVQEILGPPTLAAWKESFDVLFTALIMLDCVSRPQLAAYRSKICLFHAQYGPACWALLYQADARCRSELMETTRMRLQTKHNAAIAAGLPSTFDNNRPWDSVWAAVTLDNDFWEREFKLHAMMIKLGAAKATDIVENDAPIDQPHAPSALVPGPQDETRAKAPAKAAASKPKKEGVCGAFNRGTCHGKTCRNGYGKHQCSICSNQNHGASSCPKVGQDPKQAPANDKARDEQWKKRDWGKKGNGGYNAKKRKGGGK